MRYRLHEITLPLDYTAGELRHAVAAALGCGADRLVSVTLHRRSVDARLRRERPRFVLTVDVATDVPEEEAPTPGRGEVRIERLPDVEPPLPVPARVPRRGEEAPGPIVVGAGPAGLFAALWLAEAGARPLLLERGGPVPERAGAAAAFWRDGTLDPESNILFGEGGAGLFSDGKLTARTRDRVRLRVVLDTLVASGADPAIRWQAEPHVGSDRLRAVVPKLRERIESAGGTVRFHTRVTGVVVEAGRLVGVRTGEETLPATACVLATGHSARDVYRFLSEAALPLRAKAFAVGLRLEIPQERIDRAQFGGAAGHPRLGAASFRLARKAAGGARACYSFCMCPGGRVIACATEAGQLTTNGMSFAARSERLGNAAFLVPVGPADFVSSESAHGAGDGDAEPLAGLSYQERLECAAYAEGGGAFRLPASDLAAFLDGRMPGGLPDLRSCPRATPADLGQVLPPVVAQTLRRQIPSMLHALGTPPAGSVVLYGTETRSSSPVRVLRTERQESPGASGLFPAGEGAGYAGGIVSSAIDGLRAAEAVLERLA